MATNQAWRSPVASLATNPLWDGPNLPAAPNIPSDAASRPCFSHKFVAACLRGTCRATFPSISQERAQINPERTYCAALLPEWDPYSPQQPGDHGTALLPSSAGWHDNLMPLYEVFVRQPTHPPGWKYMGTYKCARIQVDAQQWSLLPQETRNVWTKCILQTSCGIRFLRAAGHARPKIHQNEWLHRLITDGALSLARLAMQCVGYNDTLYASMLAHATPGQLVALSRVQQSVITTTPASLILVHDHQLERSSSPLAGTDNATNVTVGEHGHPVSPTPSSSRSSPTSMVADQDNVGVVKSEAVVADNELSQNHTVRRGNRSKRPASLTSISLKLTVDRKAKKKLKGKGINVQIAFG
ncbi:hypothetical protein BC832DRAFT_69255 [Gaertneriomyces semiglobifer]|nr:hypothetical protein BC832DRAFT_69255 [Gaertneriomyces semiglobifer]